MHVRPPPLHSAGPHNPLWARHQVYIAHRGSDVGVGVGEGGEVGGDVRRALGSGAHRETAGGGLGERTALCGGREGGREGKDGVSFHSLASSPTLSSSTYALASASFEVSWHSQGSD